MVIDQCRSAVDDFPRQITKRWMINWQSQNIDSKLVDIVLKADKYVHL